MSKTKKKIRVFIADDHAIFRDGLKELIKKEKDMEITGEASSGKEALKMILKDKPDIVLMDINLPEMDGITVTGKLRLQAKDVRVVILSMYEDEAHILEGIKAGAMGYVVKTKTAEKLIDTVRTVMTEGMTLTKDIIPKFIEAVRNIEGIDHGGRGYHLTKREIELLTMLASGLSNKEIAYKNSASEKTIKNQFNHLFSKMDVYNRTQAVVKAIKEKIISLD